ncbi:MAG: hypothetical protein EA405_01480 [Rhodospirillales bacterium]|nr:MAG: hypothetical protein EA405_01480 [Rhodospirillales bacterium]
MGKSGAGEGIRTLDFNLGKCRGRPAKRYALPLALIMLEDRHRPETLARALALLDGLHQRVVRAKVV